MEEWFVCYRKKVEKWFVCDRKKRCKNVLFVIHGGGEARPGFLVYRQHHCNRSLTSYHTIAVTCSARACGVSGASQSAF